MEGRTYRVVLIEDHILTRAGLRTALESAGDISVVAEASDGIRGIAAVRSQTPDVTIVDIGLPGIDGIELTRQIRSAGLTTRVIILTMHDLEREVFAALAAGADAYCLKTSDPTSVLMAVHAVGEGAAYFDPQIAHLVLRGLATAASAHAVNDRGGIELEQSPLTPRELDVLRLVAEGVGNGEIAERLRIGLGTVKLHVREILEKLSAADRTQAAVKAFRRGLLS
jgi:DNA-binding NarL/FixJ family response regulator